MKELIEKLCNCTCFTFEELKKRNRDNMLVISRFLIIESLYSEKLKKNLKVTNSEICKEFDLTYTMVNHACKTLEGIRTTKTPLWAYYVIQIFDSLKRHYEAQETDIEFYKKHFEIISMFEGILTIDQIKLLINYGANCVLHSNRERDRNVSSIPSCQ